MKTATIFWSIVGVFFVAFLAWLFMLPKVSDADVLSMNGLHWHPHLSIRIKGEEIVIPKDVGIGATHQPLHTHADDNIIHMEFDSIVHTKDSRLGKFFEIWGKRFDENCIIDYCNGPDGFLSMKINGVATTTYQNYLMRDGDKIEIIFE